MPHLNAASDRDLARPFQVDRLATALEGIRDVQAKLIDKPLLDLGDLPDIQRVINHLQSVADSLKSLTVCASPPPP